ncbi:2TM domain-containing protein [Flagellimonas abyssi]|uniref:2TM domain-containing protein n=1 Tax=Flagellimonas abyssi TaxID=2864871 RepID=A0ABS7EP55_9FLAO|nr:2TM domain-containing protein [Allomuricauda abyssi]MBW8199210.1 2TM domain-containing protein [Allomuricauda abyssi]
MDRNSVFEKAQRKVNAIKRFYYHLTFFILVSSVLLALKGSTVDWFMETSGNSNEAFLKWIDWNILAIPIIWGAVIAVQGRYVYRFHFDDKKV